MKAKKLNYILRDSGARVLITQTNKTRIVKDAVRDVPDLQHIVLCSGSKKTKKDQLKTANLRIEISSWEDVTRPSDPSVPYKFPSLSDRDLATIIYTSGSTGEPKGIMSAHYNMVAAARSITAYLGNVEADVIVNTLPLSFDYGLYQVLMTFLFGGTLILEKSFTYPYQIIERLVGERVTGFPIVPTILAILFQMDGLAGYDFSALRYISNTAAALPVAYIRKFRSTFPHVKIFSMYGLTECKRVSYLPPDYLDRKPDSVGIPMPNVRVSIVDQKGEALGPGKIGELVVRGPNVMQGYWNLPEETKNTFRSGINEDERLLYTGDLFKQDEEGFLYFVARKDDLIKTKGERVSPKEIENVVCQMEGIIEAAVIGVPDEIAGQAIKLFIVPKAGVEVNVEHVMRHCQQNMEPFMVPRYVELRNGLPKLSSGKVDKKKLR
jgi:acyl-CoA synthetase (AMP-forming)/AMP-acid ligase II